MANIEKIINEVCREIFSLPEEEFLRLLDKNKDGDITNALLELDSLSVGSLEAEITEKYFCDELYSIESSDVTESSHLIFSDDFISFNLNDLKFYALDMQVDFAEIFSEKELLALLNEKSFQTEHILGCDDKRIYETIGEIPNNEDEAIWSIAA